MPGVYVSTNTIRIRHGVSAFKLTWIPQRISIQSPIDNGVGWFTQQVMCITEAQVTKSYVKSRMATCSRLSWTYLRRGKMTEVELLHPCKTGLTKIHLNHQKA